MYVISILLLTVFCLCDWSLLVLHFYLESLDKLEEIVVPLFTNVKNKNVKVPTYDEHPLGIKELEVSSLIIRNI